LVEGGRFALPKLHKKHNTYHVAHLSTSGFLLFSSGILQKKFIGSRKLASRSVVAVHFHVSTYTLLPMVVQHGTLFTPLGIVRFL